APRVVHRGVGEADVPRPLGGELRGVDVLRLDGLEPRRGGIALRLDVALGQLALELLLVEPLGVAAGALLAAGVTAAVTGVLLGRATVGLLGGVAAERLVALV